MPRPWTFAPIHRSFAWAKLQDAPNGASGAVNARRKHRTGRSGKGAPLPADVLGWRRGGALVTLVAIYALPRRWLRRRPAPRRRTVRRRTFSLRFLERCARVPAANLSGNRSGPTAAPRSRSLRIPAPGGLVPARGGCGQMRAAVTWWRLRGIRRGVLSTTPVTPARPDWYRVLSVLPGQGIPCRLRWIAAKPEIPGMALERPGAESPLYGAGSRPGFAQLSWCRTDNLAVDVRPERATPMVEIGRITPLLMRIVSFTFLVPPNTEHQELQGYDHQAATPVVDPLRGDARRRACVFGPCRRA